MTPATKPRQPKREARTCKWTWNMHDYWETECGEAYCFLADGPIENHYRFCPGCGASIKCRNRA